MKLFKKAEGGGEDSDEGVQDQAGERETLTSPGVRVLSLDGRGGGGKGGGDLAVAGEVEEDD